MLILFAYYIKALVDFIDGRVHILLALDAMTIDMDVENILNVIVGVFIYAKTFLSMITHIK